MASAKQIVERAWQAYIRHDLEAVMEHYAEAPS